MSTQIERLIFCDGCENNMSGDDRNFGLTFAQMRANRKDQGWIQRGAKDYCPTCAKTITANVRGEREEKRN